MTAPIGLYRERRGACAKKEAGISWLNTQDLITMHQVYPAMREFSNSVRQKRRLLAKSMLVGLEHVFP